MPRGNLYHTRAAEAVFPLACEYSVTGDPKRLRQALILADWLIGRQQEDGSWKETPEEWTGTSTDQLLMLLLSYPIVKPYLDSDADRRWLDSMERAADYLERVMDNRFASINYCATTAASLAEASLLLGKEAYARKARSLADMIVSKMNFDGFIEGEGAREGEYKYGVDIGYNLEMSLWGLARYAEIMDDAPVREAVLRSAEAHLPFIYPDGMLDASPGIRSNKWTIYGSATSDGCHPLLAMFGADNPAFLTAAVRNISRIADCLLPDGFLAPGPDYCGVMDTPPCIYHTFTKAKSLAMALSWVKGDTDDTGPLPNDGDTDVFYPTLGTAVIRRGPFCATVSAYGYEAAGGASSKYMHRPAGGAMTALWIEGFGLFQASSQTEYHRWEPMSFPEMPEDILPLTPRIEIDGPAGYFTNLYEFEAAIDYRSSDEVECVVSGDLRDRNRVRSGATYRIGYSIGAGYLEKRYEVRPGTSGHLARIVEPVVYDSALEVSQPSPDEIHFRRGGLTVVMKAFGEDVRIAPAPEMLGRCRQVYPSLRAIPIIIEAASQVTLRLTIDNSKISQDE